MKSKVFWVVVVLGLLGAAMYAGSVLATPSSGVSTTIYGQSSFSDIDVNAHSIPADIWQAKVKTKGQSDVYVVDNKLAVGGTTGWHTHPGPSLILVVQGSVTNYTSSDPTCAGQTYTAGQGFIDPGQGEVHTLLNEGSVVAETIAVQLLPKGAVRKTDEPVPDNCPF